MPPLSAKSKMITGSRELVLGNPEQFLPEYLLPARAPVSSQVTPPEDRIFLDGPLDTVCDKCISLTDVHADVDMDS